MEKDVNGHILEFSSEVCNKDLKIPTGDLNICQDNQWEMNLIHDVTMSDITRAVNTFIVKKEPEADVRESLISSLNMSNKEAVCNNALGNGSASTNLCTNDDMEENVFPKEVDSSIVLEGRCLEPIGCMGAGVPKDNASPPVPTTSNTFANINSQTDGRYLGDNELVICRNTSLPSIDASSLCPRRTLHSNTSKTDGCEAGKPIEINKTKITILTDTDDCSVPKSSVHPHNARSDDHVEHFVNPPIPSDPQQLQCIVFDNVTNVLTIFVSPMKSHSNNSNTDVCSENSSVKHTKEIVPSQPTMSSISVVKPTTSRKSKKDHFVCPIEDKCNLKFPSKSKLDKHVITHHKSKGYVCKKCDKRFFRLNHLEEHGNVHKGVKPYRCEKCGKKFHTNRQKHGHVRMVHVEPQNKSQCEICGVVGSSSSISAHKRQVHLKKRYPCKECKKVFVKPRTLRDHMFKHQPKEQYTCDLCSQTFICKNYLVPHIKSHYRTFDCPKCDKKFKVRHFLEGHLLLHDGIKKHCCNVCGKLFAHAHYLASHMKSHGEKNFECAICGGKFNRKDNLKSHIIRHQITGKKKL